MTKLFALVLALGLVGTNANAALTITIQESGADVVATASGSLDVSGLGNPSPNNYTGALAYTSPNQWLYAVGRSVTPTPADVYNVTWNTAQQLYPSAVSNLATSNSGPAVGVAWASTAGQNLAVPPGYTSGTPITSSSTWSGATLASLSLTPGTYLFDYGTDTVTFRILASSPAGATPIPAVSTLSLLLGFISLAVLGAWRARSRG